MRRQSIPTLCLLLATLLPWLTAPAEGQSDGATGPGEAAPWSVEGSPEPRRSEPGDRDDNFWSRKGKMPQALRCHLLEIEELGRIYVKDISGGSPYWVQLPPTVKIRTSYPDRFGGRKKLKLEDLEIGQLLIMTLRRSDEEVLKVRVRPADP